MTRCLACETICDPRASQSFAFFPSSLHYPKAFDQLRILYCEACGFGTTSESIPVPVLTRYYKDLYIGKAFKQRKLRSFREFDDHWFDVRAGSQFSLLQQFVDFDSVSDYYEIGPGEGAALVTLKKLHRSVNLHVSEPQEFMKPLFKDMGVRSAPDILEHSEANLYDLILMSHSLEHFNGKDIPAVVEKIARALRPRGHFFCEVPNADLGRFPIAGENVVPHLTFFTVKSIVRFLERAGLEIVFSGTAGEKQLDKKYDDALRERMERDNAFEFIEDPSGEFWLNKKLLTFESRKRKETAARSLIASVPYATKLKRRISNPGVLKTLADKHFQYGPDREFIRVIARKRNSP